MALTVNVHEAKTRLSDLLARAEAGEEILIARANKPVARLVPIVARPRQRALGLNAG
ncbi:MAG: type II toxin-antitoxin system Phd/YefM family antitoxin, partial [Betaproteobacteria bacterium]